jgi:PAP2 superfamily
MKRMIFLFIMGLIAVSVNAQQHDKSLTPNDSEARQKISLQATFQQIMDRKKQVKSFIIPLSLIAYSFISIENEGLENLNYEFKEDIWTDHPHKKLHIDNWLQFAPAISVYALNAVGIRGKNNLRDRSMIYLLSNILLNTSVSGIKKLSHQLRPDGSDYYSFPSGHTAEAFASAEFLYQEYKDVSPWYGIAGYTMAAATGYLRMYNNKHWFGDIIAGAGIGILSTKVAYWMYPIIKSKLFKDKPMNTMIMPYYQNGGGGLALAYRFHN